jgi:hypothetical protein
MKEKIKRICSFKEEDKLNFLSNELLSNLSFCVTNKISLRVYQMSMTVARTQDGLIMMTVPTTERHLHFDKDLSHQYSYETGRSNPLMNKYHVFSLLEAICYQCGFYTWEDIRK